MRTYKVHKEAKVRTIASTIGCVHKTQESENNDYDLGDVNDNENNEDETGE